MDAQELTGSQKPRVATGTGQWKMRQEQQGGDGKEREDQGKSPGAMQSTKEPSPKAVPTQGHTRGSGAAGNLQAGGKKPAKTGASICPVSPLAPLAWQKSHDEASALQGHENI